MRTNNHLVPYLNFRNAFYRHGICISGRCPPSGVSEHGGFASQQRQNFCRAAPSPCAPAPRHRAAYVFMALYMNDVVFFPPPPPIFAVMRVVKVVDAMFFHLVCRLVPRPCHRPLSRRTAFDAPSSGLSIDMCRVANASRYHTSHRVERYTVYRGVRVSCRTINDLILKPVTNKFSQNRHEWHCGYDCFAA